MSEFRTRLEGLRPALAGAPTPRPHRARRVPRQRTASSRFTRMETVALTASDTLTDRWSGAVVNSVADSLDTAPLSSAPGSHPGARRGGGAAPGTVGTPRQPGARRPSSRARLRSVPTGEHEGTHPSVPAQPASAPGTSQHHAPTPETGSAGIDESVMELLARAQAGDADAFGELYDRYVDLIYRYIYYRVGSQALAEDLTSETFLRALRRISSFTWQGRDVGAWFVTIARNLVADHYKSSRYKLEISTSDMLLTAGDAPGDSSPEGEVLSAMTNRTLLAAVKRLNPEQQECVVLRFLQGLSVSETALAMDRNEGAIKALQYRAVRNLGRMLPPGTF